MLVVFEENASILNCKSDVFLKITVFWDVTPCSLIEYYYFTHSLPSLMPRYLQLVLNSK
jgi:hypothetical protein